MDRGVVIGILISAALALSAFIAFLLDIQSSVHADYRLIQGQVNAVLLEDAVWKKGVEGDLDEFRRVLCTYPEYSGHLDCGR